MARAASRAGWGAPALGEAYPGSPDVGGHVEPAVGCTCEIWGGESGFRGAGVGVVSRLAAWNEVTSGRRHGVQDWWDL